MRQLPLGSEMCECPTCHLFFSTTANFDRHRIGPYHDNSRRCLTPQEMEAKGMVERRGVWRQQPPKKPFIRAAGAATAAAGASDESE